MYIVYMFTNKAFNMFQALQEKGIWDNFKDIGYANIAWRYIDMR